MSNLGSMTPTAEFKRTGHSNVVWSPDGQWIASVGTSRSEAVWDTLLPGP